MRKSDINTITKRTDHGGDDERQFGHVFRRGDVVFAQVVANTDDCRPCHAINS